MSDNEKLLLAGLAAVGLYMFTRPKRVVVTSPAVQQIPNQNQAGLSGGQNNAASDIISAAGQAVGSILSGFSTASWGSREEKPANYGNNAPNSSTIAVTSSNLGASAGAVAGDLGFGYSGTSQGIAEGFMEGLGL